MFRYLLPLFLLAESAAGSCDCTHTIPVPGQYRIEGPDFQDILDVEVLDGENGLCGQVVLLRHPRANAQMTCQGNFYVGVIDFMQQPIFMRNMRDSNVMSTGTEFEGVIQRPDMVRLIPGEPYQPNFTLSLVSATGPASACICQEVSEYVDFFKEVQARYRDETLLQDAINNKMPGIDADDVGWPEGKPGGDVYEPGLTVSQSYQNAIGNSMSRHIGLGSSPVAYYSAAATTNSMTCHITPPQPKTANGACRPEIVLQASMAHEEVHARRCFALREEADDDHAYHRWSNYPPNHARDEIEAYQAGIEVLEEWLDSNCQ